MSKPIRVRLKVFATDGKGHQEFTLDVPRVMDEQSYVCLQHVSQFIYALKEHFPGNEFQVVPVGRNRYNVLPQPLTNA